MTQSVHTNTIHSSLIHLVVQTGHIISDEQGVISSYVVIVLGLGSSDILTQQTKLGVIKPQFVSR